MISIITALIPLLAGISQPLKDYFSYKAKEAEQLQQLELARIEAEKQAVISGNEAESVQMQARLSSTSREFKQSTFYLLVLPVVFSVFFPEAAAAMWENFKQIPEWFQILFVSVYSSIWGLPIAKEYLGGMFRSIGNVMAARREYKLAQLDKKNFYDILRSVKGRVTQKEVEVFNTVIDKINAPGSV